MAATVSAWAKPGAWALDSEENESELLKENASHDDASSNNGDSGAVSDFPSLAAANATKPKKKSKGQKLSLQEFTTYSAPKPQQSKGLTPNEMLALPTGPRERSADEIERSKLGGGFKSYGYDRPGRDEQPRRQRDSEFTPSRADEIDDWGANKKSSIGNGFDRREKGERGGFFPDSKSRADEVDNWASNKAFVPSSDSRRYEKRGGFESSGAGGGADSDNWSKRKEEEGRRSGNSFDSLRDKRGASFESSNGGGTDSDTWSRRGGEEGSGRPRLNLQPRTLPVGEVQQQVGEGQQQDGIVAKPKVSNPFGNARPREEVLKEKGQDPKEIEEKLPVDEVQQQDVVVAKPKGSNPFGNARPREEVLKEKKGQDPKEIEEKLESVKVKGAAGLDGPPAFGKRGFGTGSWRGSSPEDKKERSWRKPESLDASRPPSNGAESLEAAVESGDAQNDA